jgi:glycosyltransferase involved in cell wall biosynthesis
VQTKSTIKISAIVPVYQDKDGLTDTINSLIAQDFPQEQYEIIIADNNSRDGTKQLAAEFQKKYPGLIKVVHQDQFQSSYATRNAGVKIARGEICCFIDADMTAGRDYLKRIYSYFSQNDVDYLGCNIRITGTHKSFIEKFNHLFAFPMQKYLEEGHFAVTACLSVKKSIFKTVGMFDYRLESGGDQEFGHRVWRSAFKQSYCHDIILYHPPRTSILSLVKKELRKTRGKIQMAHFYPARYQHHVENFFRISSYLPPKISTVKKRGHEKGIELSYIECFLLSLLHSFIRYARLLEIIRQKCIKKNHCLNLQNTSSTIEHDRRLKVYFIVFHPDFSNYRMRLIYGLKEHYPELFLVSTGHKGGSDQGITISGIYHNPLGILNKIGLGKVETVLDKYIYFPSPRRRYVKAAQKKLAKIILSDIAQGCRICVINSLPHHDLGLIGLYLKKRFPSIKWIVDWRDLWSYDDNYFKSVAPIYRNKLIRLEREIFDNCDLNVTTNDFAKEVLITRYKVPSENIVTIEHAFSRKDIENQFYSPADSKYQSGDTINVGFLGNLSKPPRVSGVKILNVIKSVNKSGIDVVLNVYGDKIPEIRKIVNKSFSDVAVLHGRLPHKESLKKIACSDFLLLALEDLPNSHIVNLAKLPHYLMLGKPILAMVPEKSFVANVIRETNTGFVIPPGENAAEQMVSILRRYKETGIYLKVNKDVIEKYNWERISQKWIDTINEVCFDSNTGRRKLAERLPNTAFTDLAEKYT